MPTNNLAPKAKNKLGIASSIPPNMAERFGAAVSPYLQSAQALFPATNPYGQALSNFLLGQAPQAAQQMAAGYPNVLFDTSNPLGGNRIVNPAALDMLGALPVATAVKGAGALAKSAPLIGGITTWHGSPHLFPPTELNDLGEFNAAKIGSGEGTQLEGYGHYLGEAGDVGKSYADWTPIKIDGRPIKYQFPNSGNNKKYIPEYDGPINDWAKHALAGATHPDEAVSRLTSSINKIKQDPSSTESDQMAMRNMTGAVEWIEKNRHRIQGSYVYKVDIPDDLPSRMLDWNANGKKTWADAVTQHGTPAAAAKALFDAGIPGVRYLDAGSRLGTGGPNTSNFVVFPGNEHMMTILERNGQAMSPESQAIARYREIKGPKSVVRMEAALRTAGVPLPKNEPVAYIQKLVDLAHRRN